jgi:hypothetical protein
MWWSMFFRAIVAFVLSGAAAVPLPAGAPHARIQGDIVPRPTEPAAPRNPTDLLLRTSLAEVLKEPREFIRPRHGPVLILRDGPHVTPHILPADTPRGIALVSAEQLTALAASGATGGYFYLTLKVLSMDARQAVVNVQLLPAVAGGAVALCCWTIDRRYRRTADGWIFDRLVGAGVY